MKITQLLDRPIAYHRVFVTLTGSVKAAIMLSQAVYWQPRAKQSDGWWYKTAEEWTEETGLSEYEQRSARKAAEKYLLSDLRGIPATLYYKVNEEALEADLLQTSGAVNQELVGEKLKNINKNTETTTETTTPKVKKSLPANSGMDWMVAAGVSAVDMAATNDKIAREAEVANLYESAMGYNPLNWQDKDMPELLRFLMTKSPDEIKAFAKWSRKEYSTFPPTKARQFPLRVKEFWPLAFADQTNKPYQPEESWL